MYPLMKGRAGNAQEACCLALREFSALPLATYFGIAFRFFERSPAELYASYSCRSQSIHCALMIHTPLHMGNVQKIWMTRFEMNFPVRSSPRLARVCDSSYQTNKKQSPLKISSYQPCIIPRYKYVKEPLIH